MNVNVSRASANSEEKKTSTKIILIGTYFGQWPVWFPAFLLSCAKNNTIEWLFFTNCEIPDVTYPNIKFERMDLAQLNDLASKKLGCRVQKLAYSQVDLQPAYGVIFEEYIKEFDFWGHCDLDVVWGDIRSFITEEILQNYDIVSPRKNFLAGHLTLWRNKPDINKLFHVVPVYRDILASSEHFNFDEAIISTFLKTLLAKGSIKLKIYWPEEQVVWFRGRTHPIGWYWDSGKIFDAKHRERIYLHYQHWKKLVTSIDFQIGDQPARFEFTRHGIRSRRLSARDLFYERFSRGNLRKSISKLIDGFKKSLRLLKMILLVKDFYWAQRLVANSINARDVQYDRKAGLLFLKHLSLHIGKQQSFLLESYWWAVQLVRQWSAKFYSDEQAELFVEVAGLRASVQRAEEIFILKELFVDGIYNVLFSRPAVVWDIGMNVGLVSIYFASQPDVIVVGYEPCKRQYKQALHNISLNPTLSDKIRTFQVGIGSAKYKSIAGYPPKIANQPGLFASRTDNGMGPKFEYEEIEIEDAANMLDLIITDYPERDIILKISLGNSEYYIDGVSEYSIIKRLHTTGKLNLIDAIMLEWHKGKPLHDPHVIARQLSDYGFKIFLFAPRHPHEGMLYAVRETSSTATPSQQ